MQKSVILFIFGLIFSSTAFAYTAPQIIDNPTLTPFVTSYHSSNGKISGDYSSPDAVCSTEALVDGVGLQLSGSQCITTGGGNFSAGNVFDSVGTSTSCPAGLSFTPDQMQCFASCPNPYLPVSGNPLKCQQACPIGYNGSGFMSQSNLGNPFSTNNPSGYSSGILVGSFTGVGGSGYPNCQLQATASVCVLGVCGVDISYTGSSAPSAPSISTLQVTLSTQGGAGVNAPSTATQAATSAMNTVGLSASNLSSGQVQAQLQPIQDIATVNNNYVSSIDTYGAQALKAANALTAAQSALSASAAAVAANPTSPSAASTYQTNVTNFNSASKASQDVITSLNSAIIIAQNNLSQGQQQQTVSTQTVSQAQQVATAISTAQPAVTAAGGPQFDATAINNLIGGLQDLATANASLQAALNTAVTKLATATTIANNAINNNSVNNSYGQSAGQMAAAANPSAPQPQLSNAGQSLAASGSAASGVVVPSVPASTSGTGTNLTLPTDYARQGEAAAAASGVIAAISQVNPTMSAQAQALVASAVAALQSTPFDSDFLNTMNSWFPKVATAAVGDTGTALGDAANSIVGTILPNGDTCSALTMSPLVGHEPISLNYCPVVAALQPVVDWGVVVFAGLFAFTILTSATASNKET